MRKIQTFILRLLTNTDEPHTLRGVVTAVTSDEVHTFRDGEGLLVWLRQMHDATTGGQQSDTHSEEAIDDA